LIDTEFCKQNNLKTTGNIKGQGVGSEAPNLSFVNCEALSLTGVKMIQQTLVAFPLAKDFKKVNGFSVDGLLGFDFLSRFITKIDFTKRLIHLYDSDKFKYEGSGSVIAAKLINNIFAIPLVIDDRYKGDWTIDTGAKNLSFHYPFAKEHDFNKKEGILGIGGGIGGEYTYKKARFKNVTIGNFKIDNPLCTFPVDSIEGAFGSKTKIGNLGTDLLRHFIAYFDYKNNQLILEEGEDFNKVFPENHTGLVVKYNDQRLLTVKFVSPNSLAQKAGLRKDDIILSVNNRAVEDYDNLIDLKNTFMLPAGTILPFSIKRNDNILNLEIHLEKVI